jgi:hypothetical protein
MNRLPLLLAPELAFTQLDDGLRSLGWQREANSTVPEPILSDEPEYAAWTHDKTRLVYTFHPAFYLRVLAFEGENAKQHRDELSAMLPLLTPKDLRALLSSGTVEEALAGIYGAGVLGAVELLEPIAALVDDEDPLIAKAAQDTEKKLLARMVTLGLVALAERSVRQPERSVTFSLVGSESQKRQVLRWMMRQNRETNPSIDAVLRTALDDPDWETRATAMLAVGRLRSAAVLPQIRNVQLPEKRREGVDDSDRRVLDSLREGVLALLAGTPLPPLSRAPLNSRDTVRAHILRCIAGQPVAWHERFFLWALTLTQPFDPPDLAPSSLPQGVILDDQDRFMLGEIELAWIPPVACWLGDDLDKPRIPNPIRLMQPGAGFFIALEPVENSALATIEEVAAYCVHLSSQFGCVVRIPFADEWELAVRGTDGRRYPFGNAYDANGLTQPSVWGLEQPVTVPQWALLEDGQAVIVGGEDQPRCSLRRPGDSAAVRPVVI